MCITQNFIANIYHHDHFFMNHRRTIFTFSCCCLAAAIVVCRVLMRFLRISAAVSSREEIFQLHETCCDIERSGLFSSLLNSENLLYILFHALLLRQVPFREKSWFWRNGMKRSNLSGKKNNQASHTHELSEIEKFIYFSSSTSEPFPCRYRYFTSLFYREYDFFFCSPCNNPNEKLMLNTAEESQ